jgi:hypothetical protein
MNRVITFVITSFVLAVPTIGLCQASLKIEPVKLTGPRELQEQTRTGAIRDYLEAWKSFSAALNQNRPDLLDADFVGTSKDKLKETIQQQAALGLHTKYKDLSHDLEIVFYSPEGLSIEMTDKIEYDMQVFDHDKNLGTQHVSTRYVVVLTPSEVRWRVRVFQAVPE